ncbi:conserved hypothetical protein [Catenulispora acidiphila DSM 44928]|uniref:DUF4097 domain-containing protein n=1 Tax=Catenulispora acidiphila (strain DSM 44928 / JCM 14897 / NBRC 102108 / NRRL B-24433 / ID139908) TaxID=479433 RepID=C7Q9Y1_CATAD|nr:DUF4097 family beta strand repeat-containing protein [Catenulispora acidiphila]ACU76300.1 conserved hypothetical protein [Catenulispora acidiphila DSM 44928]
MTNTQKYTTTSPVSVNLDIPAGSVHLIAGDRTDTIVEVLPADSSKRRDVKAAQQIGVEYRDGVLSIAAADANRLLGSSGAVRVTIQLPTGSRLEGKAGAAELHSTGRLGEVSFDGGYGSVSVEEAASAYLTVHTGDVRISRLAGPAQIRNGKGDITIAEAHAGRVELHADMGNLSVAAAHGVSGVLDAGTASGRIANALYNAEGAAAALSIKATTSLGDITAGSL